MDFFHPRYKDSSPLEDLPQLGHDPGQPFLHAIVRREGGQGLV